MNQHEFAAALSEDLRRLGVGFRQPDVETFAANRWAQVMSAPDVALERQVAEARLVYIRWVVKRDRARFVILYGLVFTVLGFGCAVAAEVIDAILGNPVGWNGGPAGVAAGWQDMPMPVAMALFGGLFGGACMSYGACALAWVQWRSRACKS